MPQRNPWDCWSRLCWGPAGTFMCVAAFLTHIGLRRGLHLAGLLPAAQSCTNGHAGPGLLGALLPGHHPHS